MARTGDSTPVDPVVFPVVVCVTILAEVTSQDASVWTDAPVSMMNQAV